MRDYAKKQRTDAPKGLSHWDKGGRDTRSGYSKQPNAEMKPMTAVGSRTYPKGNSEFKFGKVAKPFERVMDLEEGGGTSDWSGESYADPASMAGPEYAASSSPSYDAVAASASSYAGPAGGGMRDSNIPDASGVFGGNAGTSSWGEAQQNDYGRDGGWQGAAAQSGIGMGAEDGGGNGGWESQWSHSLAAPAQEPGFSGNAGAILSEATAPAQAASPTQAIMDAPLPTTDAYGRTYGNQSYQAPADLVGAPPTLDKPLPSYNYAQGRYGYAMTAKNVPQDQTVLDGLVDIAIEKGINPDDFVRKGFRESSFNPNAKNGQYQGMFQMSNAKAVEHGIDRRDWKQNANAAATDLAKWNADFQKQYNRQPTRGESYLGHQQGVTGFQRLMDNPDMNAIQARKSREAILGNVEKPDRARAENFTSREFMDYWEGKLE